MAAERASRSERDSSIDLVRGLVMCLMVLDHARDFLTSTPFSPTDPDRTSTALFFTRWITHFCAPAFMLLAGAGVGISRARGRDSGSLSRFLWTRGVWLVLLELTWVHFGWTFELDLHRETAQVIWALGWCMVLLAGLVLLPDSIIGAFGVALVVGHNAFDEVRSEQLGAWAPVWTVLHRGGPWNVAPGFRLFVAYPLVPWVGVMALGYLLGRRWRSLGRGGLVAAGLACIGTFMVLRTVGVYGDPRPFAQRPEMSRTLFSLLDCTKYPPSLEYLLMTLGPVLVLLGSAKDRPTRRAIPGALVTFGRVPLFFYLLHLLIVHGLALPLRAHRGLPLVSGPFDHGLDLPLAVVYLVAAVAIFVLWWPCRRWAALKAAHPGGWLSYL